LQFTCPGTGSKNLVELGAYVSTATSGNVRVAIYADDRDPLVAQGSAEIAVGAAGWYTHTSFTDSTGAALSGTGLLTGGTDYTICMIADGSVQHYHDTVSGSAIYKNAEYTGGYPASYDDASGSTRQITIRAGVQ